MSWYNSYSTGVRCPSCLEGTMVYNGNYFCDNPDCLFSLPTYSGRRRPPERQIYDAFEAVLIAKLYEYRVQNRHSLGKFPPRTVEVGQSLIVAGEVDRLIETIHNFIHPKGKRHER